MLSIISSLLIANLTISPATIAQQPTLSPPPDVQPKPPSGWTITNVSGNAEISLAKHLTGNNVKMYGAYWCPHCFEQKQLFGKQAWAKVSYVECANDVPNGNPRLCRRQEITGYPTWIINGKKYPGVKSLKELARLSGYRGNNKFKYSYLLNR